MTDDLGSMFPGPKSRPDHPDFWRLSELLLKLDSDLDPSNPDEAAKEAQWQARMAEVEVDLDSLTYSAMQRAFRIVGIQNPLELIDPQKMRQVALLTSVWLEGFAAGTFYERKHGL